MSPENRKALYARAEQAIRALYHNATPTYPTTDSPDFEQWFQDAAEGEIDYLGSGGAHGTDYYATLAAPCNAGRYKSARAREQYIGKGMRDYRAEVEDCGALTGWKVLELSPALGPAGKPARAAWARLMRAMRVPLTTTVRRNNPLWEYITDYGKLYTFGRGGRTLAPVDLWKEDGRGHGARFDVTTWNAESATRAIQVLESFNAYVSAWCKSVPEQWAEYEREQAAERKAEARARIAAKAKETRERHYWEARGVVTC